MHVEALKLICSRENCAHKVVFLRAQENKITSPDVGGSVAPNEHPAKLMISFRLEKYSGSVGLSHDPSAEITSRAI